MITFATFHVENNQTDAKAEIQSRIVSKNIYHLLLELLFRSACVFHPDCKQVVLSDPATNFSYLDPAINIFRTEIGDRHPLMFSRLAAQIRYVKSIAANSNLIFLDSDVLINSNLNSLFEQDFDIALTYREGEDMPINWGVMFVSTRNQAAVIQFLERVLENYRTKYLTSSIFWCDQYALMDTIDRERFFKRSSDLLEIDGVKIQLLPCDIYNFSPSGKTSSILFGLKDKQIIHFKGARKRLIEPYWQMHLQWQGASPLKKAARIILVYPKFVFMALGETISALLTSFIPSCQAFLNKALQKGRKLMVDRAN